MFATQKNMDAIEKTPEPVVVPQIAKKSQEQETLKMMLETL